MKISRILHYPGSKWSMADWIIEHMPEHEVYLEPFFGSGAVLFNKAPSKIEPTGDEMEDARRFLIRCWMARGAKTSDRTGWTHH